MSIYVGKDKATLFHGDHHPASLYKGDKLIAGYEIATMTGKEQISFESSYKANMDAVKGYGCGKQDGTPTPESPIEPKFYPGGTITDGTITAQIPVLRALPDGSVRDEYDVRTGVLTRKVREFIFSPDIKWNQFYNSVACYRVFADCEKVSFNESKAYISNFAIKGTNTGGVDGTFTMAWFAENNNWIVLNRQIAVSEWEKIVADRFNTGNPLKVWYALATPIIEHLPPKLLTQHPGYTILTQTPNEVPVKKTVEGQVVAVDDVSETVHEVECKVERVNFLPITSPYEFTRSKMLKLPRPLTGTITFSCSKIESEDTDSQVCALNLLDIDGNVIFGKLLQRGTTQIWTVTIPPDRPASAAYFYASNSWGNSQNDKATITDGQIEPGSVATPYTPYIPDLSKVVVSRYGASLFKPAPYQRYSWAATIAGLTDFIKSYHISDFTISYDVEILEVLDNYNPDDNKTGFLLFFDGLPTKGQTAPKQITVGAKYHTFVTFRLNGEEISKVNDSGIYPCGSGSSGGGTARYQVTNFMVNIGGEKPYTDYITSQTLTPLPSGVVEGMTSLSPNMTILTDNPGAVITATYDTNQNEETIYADVSAKVYKEDNNEK